MDNNIQKNKLRFNIIDFLIIVAIAAVIVVFAVRGGIVQKISSFNTTIEYTVKITNVQKESFDLLNEGNVIYFDEDDRAIGKIVSKSYEPSVMYTVLSNGEIVKTTNADGRIDMYLTLEADGTVDEDGCMVGGDFFVGSGKNMACYSDKLYFNAEVTDAKEKN